MNIFYYRTPYLYTFELNFETPPHCFIMFIALEALPVQCRAATAKLTYAYPILKQPLSVSSTPYLQRPHLTSAAMVKPVKYTYVS